MEKIDILAKIIAKAVTGFDPETQVYYGEPYRIMGICSFFDIKPQPLWTHGIFIYAASQILEAGFDRKEEQASPKELEVPADEDEPVQPPMFSEEWRQNVGLA
jgi:hypothetical protein